MKPITTAIIAICAVTATALAAVELDLEWRDKLYVPTYIGKHDNNYVIVNCWQHRLIYSNNINEEIKNWSVLDDEIAGPHSFVTYKNYLLAEDTGRDALILYKWIDHTYTRVQRLTGISRRPHRVQWDSKSGKIWVLTSDNQKLYQINFQENEMLPLSIDTSWDLPFLNQEYTRSFSIINDRLYFVSGPSKIHEVAPPCGKIQLLKSYDIPSILGRSGGMNDIFRSSDGWWYFSSSSTGALIRSQSLEDLSLGIYEDIKSKLGLKGTPYYLSEFENRIWVATIYDENSVISFHHDKDGNPTDIVHHFKFGPQTKSDAERETQFPK